MLREHFIHRDWTEPSPKALKVDTLEQARAFLPPGLTRLAREPDDEPQVVESWV